MLHSGEEAQPSRQLKPVAFSDQPTRKKSVLTIHHIHLFIQFAGKLLLEPER